MPLTTSQATITVSDDKAIPIKMLDANRIKKQLTDVNNTRTTTLLLQALRHVRVCVDALSTHLSCSVDHRRTQ
jgi:hypothetical protein